MVNEDILEYENELVSVIIPTYNSEKYIEETILSVENQTYKNIEIVITDDCSKDKTIEIINKLMKKYNNIKLFRNSINSGAAVARNNSIKNSKGRYIAFLDSDDLWKPTKIELQIKAMNEKECSFVYSSYDVKNLKKISVLEKANYNILLKNTTIATTTVIVDRKYYGTVLMPNRRTGQDYAYWLKLFKIKDGAFGLQESLAILNIRNNSLSKNKLNNIKDVWEIQIKNENINHLRAGWNIIFYIGNAFFKRYK